MPSTTTIFEDIEKELLDQGFCFERKDFQRPWGGFFVIEEAQAAEFVARYFPGFDTADLIEIYVNRFQVSVTSIHRI